jgi:hypothetical protein
MIKMVKGFNNLEKVLLAFVALLGGLMLFIPIQYLFFGLISIIALIYLLFNPKACFYLLVFSIPFIERIRVLPISFSPNDIVILICAASTILSMFRTKFKVSVKTSIDKWNLILLIVYFLSGMTSLSPTGVLSSFKFLEAILVFYMIVYLIRAKEMRISDIIKAFLFTGLCQAVTGILQSTTGQFGAGFHSQRGILGYFGIGSKTVWHAWGAFGGNGMLPEFLILAALFVLPFLKHLKLNKSNKFLWAIFAVAIYMGYSKESILVLIVCLIIYFNLMAKNPREAIFKTGAFTAIVAIALIAIMSTAYMDTITETIQGRLLIWRYPIYALSNNMQYLFFGSGLNSYWELIDPLLEPYIFEQAHFSMLAHNYYLLTVQEFGLVGTGFLFAFFISMWKKFVKNVEKYKGYYKKFNIIGAMFISTIFTTSFFGQFYYHTFGKVLIYIFLGVILAKENTFAKLVRKCN